MIISTHIISGGFAGEMLQNPILAFLVGIISHFILDAVPHTDNFMDGKCRWNCKQTIFTSVDIFLTIGLLVFLHPALTIHNSFWWGALGGLLPDLIDNVPILRGYLLKYKIVQKYHAFHEATHLLREPNIILGMLSQVMMIVVFVALYFVVK